MKVNKLVVTKDTAAAAALAGLSVTGGTTIVAGNVIVTGGLTVSSGGLGVTGGLTLTGGLTSSAVVKPNGGLTVEDTGVTITSGSNTNVGGSFGAMDVSGTLQIGSGGIQCGGFAIDDAVAVTGTMDITGGLRTGALSADKLTATAAATSGGNLVATGSIAVGQNLKVTASGVTANGGSTLASLSTGSNILDVNNKLTITSGELRATKLYSNTRSDIYATGLTVYSSNLVVTTGIDFTSTSISINNYQSTSDVRLKEDFRKMKDPLSQMLAVKGVTYKWNVTAWEEKKGTIGESSRDLTMAGVIAQNVREVLPEAVMEDYRTPGNNTSSSDSELSVDYDSLMSLLIDAVKELDAFTIGCDILSDEEKLLMDDIDATVVAHDNLKIRAIQRKNELDTLRELYEELSSLRT